MKVKSANILFWKFSFPSGIVIVTLSGGVGQESVCWLDLWWVSRGGSCLGGLPVRQCGHHFTSYDLNFLQIFSRTPLKPPCCSINIWVVLVTLVSGEEMMSGTTDLLVAEVCPQYSDPAYCQERLPVLWAAIGPVVWKEHYCHICDDREDCPHPEVITIQKVIQILIQIVKIVFEIVFQIVIQIVI